MTDLQEDNKFEEFEHLENFSDLNTDNLIFEVWVKPKKVFQYLFKFDRLKYVHVLLVVSAIVAATERVLSKNTPFDSYGFGYLIGYILGGAIVTWLMYWVSAWFLRFFGAAFFNGKASNEDFRIVIAWSNIPLITSLLTTLLLILFYGNNAASGYYLIENETERIVFIVLGCIDIVLAIWSAVISVIGIMHIQQFGVWKAIGNIFLPFIILVAIFALFFLGINFI